MTELKQLPYVDGIPDEGQRRIDWIKNGDLLEGSETKYGNGGNLNTAGVQIQKNIITLFENLEFLLSNQNEIYVDIDKINEILSDLNNVSLIETVNSHSKDIADINDEIEIFNESINLIKADQDRLKEIVGDEIPGNGSNSILMDLFIIKTNIGNKFGFDINGQASPDNPASGLFLRIDDITTQVNTNKSDIGEIKDKLNSADLDGISKNIDGMRQELGQKPQTSNTIYERLDDLEGAETEIKSDISEIKLSIGTGKIIDKVNKNSSDIVDINESIDGPGGIKEDIATLNNVVFVSSTGLVSRMDAISKDVDGLKVDVGNKDSGLIKSNTDIRALLGIDSVTADSVLGQLNSLDNDQTLLDNRLQDIEVSINTPTTGIGDIARTNKSAIFGNSQSEDPVEKAGLMASTKAIRTGLAQTNQVLTSIIDRIPYTGLKFASISDGTYTNIDEAIASRLNMTYFGKSVKGQGISSLSQLNDFSDVITANVILVNVGTYDYGFNFNLGSIDDANNSYSGQPSFYNELYKLLDSIITPTSKSRVFITNGYRTTEFTDSVKYPNKNSLGKSLNDYSKAIEDVAKIFGIPVIDTNNELGISPKNSKVFLNSTGFTDEGSKRFLNLVSGSISSK
ncbi:phage neck protein fibritin [Acinetobacter baumannii]